MMKDYLFVYGTLSPHRAPAVVRRAGLAALPRMQMRRWYRLLGLLQMRNVFDAKRSRIVAIFILT